MNLELLNDGTVFTKPFLNPVCNVLRCNNLITENIENISENNCSYTNSSNIFCGIGQNITSGIDTPIVSSPNFNTANSTYTVTTEGLYNITCRLTVSTNASGINNNQAFITLNGIARGETIGAVQSSVPVSFCRNTITTECLRFLTVGVVIGFVMSFIGTDPNANIAPNSTNFIIQKL